MSTSASSSDEPFSEIFIHDKLVKTGSVWIVREYSPAEPERRYNGRVAISSKPARVYTSWARADVTYDYDDHDKLVPRVTWYSFGSEIPLENRYANTSDTIQPLFEVSSLITPDMLNSINMTPIPDFWDLPEEDKSPSPMVDVKCSM